MIVPIRIYRAHDFDLIIMKLCGYKLVKEMKKCLIAYANGESYEPPVYDFDGNYDGYIRYSYLFNMRLNPDKPEEAAAINLLNQIRYGFRCSFIRTLFRSNIPYLPLMQYSKECNAITRRITAEDIETERQKALTAKKDKPVPRHNINMAANKIKLEESNTFTDFISVPLPEPISNNEGKEEPGNTDSGYGSEDVDLDIFGALDAMEDPG